MILQQNLKAPKQSYKKKLFALGIIMCFVLRIIQQYSLCLQQIIG